ncbi:septum formation initiator family protein [Saccharomonospora sp. NB11]|uniref:FtsB family cell division protein n=1 Tax=Saccharomonospora sp. NB11 TaxID=1642298 RepID=UPI0018D1608A|nr:septum formation initiator [Saccharomonospora sp. NB11]
MTVPTRRKPAATRTSGGGSSRSSATAKAGARSGAGQRAYARRSERAAPATTRPRATRRGLQNWPKSRATFVVVLMALMVCGVATSLWLSTQAIADSYRLDRLKERNAQLVERAEQLRREVGQLQSPVSLAERAEGLGMVPAGNPARLVVRDDGSVSVVGEPVEATAPPRKPERSGEEKDDR